MLYWFGKNNIQDVIHIFCFRKPTLHIHIVSKSGPIANSFDQFSWICRKLLMVSCCCCWKNSLAANQKSYRHLSGRQLWGSLEKCSEHMLSLQELSSSSGNNLHKTENCSITFEHISCRISIFEKVDGYLLGNSISSFPFIILFSSFMLGDNMNFSLHGW